MPTYYVRYSATIQGETSIEASDIRDAIETLDDEYFDKKIFEDVIPSTFHIDAVEEI